MSVRECVRVCVCECVCECVRVCVRACAHVRVTGTDCVGAFDLWWVHIIIYARARAHARAYARAHTCKHTHAHARTYSCIKIYRKNAFCSLQAANIQYNDFLPWVRRGPFLTRQNGNPKHLRFPLWIRITDIRPEIN